MSELSALRQAPAWAELQSHFEQIGGTHLRDLFAADPERGERLVAEGAGLYLDFSKNRIIDETLLLLGSLAQQRGVAERRDAMFAGEHINVSEDRAVLHVALRMPRNRSLVVDGVDVVQRGARDARPDGGVLRAGALGASGAATPANRSATSSTSASAAPTSAR